MRRPTPHRFEVPARHGAHKNPNDTKGRNHANNIPAPPSRNRCRRPARIFRGLYRPLAEPHVAKISDGLALHLRHFEKSLPRTAYRRRSRHRHGRHGGGCTPVRTRQKMSDCAQRLFQLPLVANPRTKRHRIGNQSAGRTAGRPLPSPVFACTDRRSMCRNRRLPSRHRVRPACRNRLRHHVARRLHRQAGRSRPRRRRPVGGRLHRIRLHLA